MKRNIEVYMSQDKLNKNEIAIINVAIANAKDRILSNEVLTERQRLNDLKESFSRVLKNIEDKKLQDED